MKTLGERLDEHLFYWNILASEATKEFGIKDNIEKLTLEN